MLSKILITSDIPLVELKGLLSMNLIPNHSIEQQCNDREDLTSQLRKTIDDCRDIALKDDLSDYLITGLQHGQGVALWMLRRHWG